MTAKKILIRLTACAVALYLLTLTALYCLQERLLFHPAPLAPNHSFHFAAPFAEIRLPADGATLHGLYFPATPPVKGRLLFYHGNTGSLDDWGGVAARFAALGYDSYAFDYRGYGKSDGRIESEAQLNADADRMAAYVQQQGSGRFAVVGYSLGSGLAARAAQKYRADILLLAAPLRTPRPAPARKSPLRAALPAQIPPPHRSIPRRRPQPNHPDSWPPRHPHPARTQPPPRLTTQTWRRRL